MASSNRPVQRNFLLPAQQAEWLRDYAFRTRRPQAAVVREALADFRARAEAAPGTSDHSHHEALVRRFSAGDGIDLDVLRDENGQMWGSDT